jgi:transcriptional regulator with XRE-family HTH domain
VLATLRVTLRSVPESPGQSPAVQPTAFARWLDSLIPAVYPTDTALARAIGADKSTVSRWRRGAVPAVPQLLKLSKETGTDISALLKIAGYEQ